MSNETTTYAEGDLVTVISDFPTYRTAYAILPSPRAPKGALKRVEEVWEDGDLTVHDPDDSTQGRTVLSPQHVEPYVAPAITAPFARVDLTAWQTALADAVAAYGMPYRAILAVPRSTGWETVQEGLDRAQAIIDETQAPEVDPMIRRASALVLAGNVLAEFGQTALASGGEFHADLDDTLAIADYLLEA